MLASDVVPRAVGPGATPLNPVQLMKPLVSLALVGVLATTTATFAGSPLKVSASQAIRIAVIDTADRRSETPELLRVFGPRFEQAAARIYGADTQVEFVRVGPDMAADGLRRGVYDGSLVLSGRLPAPIRRAGFHALRATPLDEKREATVFLVLRQEQPQLDNLLANAFSVALHDAEVRRVLLDQATAVALASR